MTEDDSGFGPGFPSASVGNVHAEYDARMDMINLDSECWYSVTPDNFELGFLPEQAAAVIEVLTAMLQVRAEAQQADTP